MKEDVLCLLASEAIAAPKPSARRRRSTLAHKRIKQSYARLHAELRGMHEVEPIEQLRSARDRVTKA